MTFEKLLLVAVLAAFLVGPERLPAAAAGLANLVKRVKGWVSDTGSRFSDELGEDFAIDELKKFDPRKYDPRRIIMNAWFEDDAEHAEEGPRKRPPSAAAARQLAAAAGLSVPFDNEAT
ncbi:MAG: Sec-independent protein translocase TatB [Microbacteriaceae bacterium]